MAYFCANHALVTKLSFSRMAVNVCGFSVITTTAFWTVLRVTSAGLLSSSLESSWRVQLMPNNERSGVLFNTSVKYEKSSVALRHGRLAHSCIKVVALERWMIYAWAPSDKARKGSRCQSLSMAGSYPWSTPTHRSTSGPLDKCELMSTRATGCWEALPLVVEVDDCYYGVICVGHGAILSPNAHFAADK